MATYTNLGNAPAVASMMNDQSLLIEVGGSPRRISLENFRNSLNLEDEQLLREVAFYIDLNKASSLGSTRVDVGGNTRMREMWENAKMPVLMDANGNYSLLNSNDCRYTAEGEYLLKDDGTIIDKYAHCDFMEIIPQSYGRIQVVTVGDTTLLRPWFSLVPLPSGYTIPMLVVGKFKAYCTAQSSSGIMRSIPGVAPTGGLGSTWGNINDMWNAAQARSKSHGLAGLDFRNYLLFHVMSKYGYRDSQNAKTSDGTLVYGVGLDGTGGLLDGETAGNNGFSNQRLVKTGAVLSLGDNDGNVPVTLNNGGTAHSVNVCGFENPWGQYWEMVQGLCSVGADVYFWRGNVMPTGTPTADTFDKIEHVTLQRSFTANVCGMNIISDADRQGVYMIPKENLSNVSYGDYYGTSEAGQLWLFGGSSDSGSYCGLAYANSHRAWSYSFASLSARLAYYGSVRKVSPTELASLAA